MIKRLKVSFKRRFLFPITHAKEKLRNKTIFMSIVCMRELKGLLIILNKNETGFQKTSKTIAFCFTFRKTDLLILHLGRLCNCIIFLHFEDMNQHEYFNFSFFVSFFFKKFKIKIMLHVLLSLLKATRLLLLQREAHI